MKRTLYVAALALSVSGCMQGYWPTTTEPKDARYYENARECQTATQVGLASGAPQGTAAFALDIMFVGEKQGSPSAIDACMANHGYHLSHAYVGIPLK